MSNTEVAKPSQYDDPQLVATIRQTVCKNATDAQLRMFLEIAKRTGLDPFLREIWFVAETGVIMAGRDGYLRIANEHPMFDGMETRVERNEQGVPIKATCSVWRKDRSHPITCEAYYNEYAKGSPVWRQYKSAMIGKVAEVLALKRSFSINGVVTEEEIGNQETPVDGKQAWADGVAAAKAVAEEKLAEMRGGKSYEDVSAPDPRREQPEIGTTVYPDNPITGEKWTANSVNAAQFGIERIVSGIDATKAQDDPFPPPEPPFSMAKSIAEFGKLKELAVKKLGQERGMRLYYKVLADHGAKHANDLKFAKPSRDCYRAMAREIDAALQTVPASGPAMVPSHIKHLTDAMTIMGRNGDKKTFFKVLGAFGYENIQDVPADAAAEILRELQASDAAEMQKVVG